MVVTGIMRFLLNPQKTLLKEYIKDMQLRFGTFSRLHQHLEYQEMTRKWQQLSEDQKKEYAPEKRRKRKTHAIFEEVFCSILH
jgi:hypothetical protein